MLITKNISIYTKRSYKWTKSYYWVNNFHLKNMNLKILASYRPNYLSVSRIEFSSLCFYYWNYIYTQPSKRFSSWLGFLCSSWAPVRGVPEFFLANQYLLLLNTILSVFFTTTPSHPLSKGSNSIHKIAGFPNYCIPIGSQDPVHLQEHIFHITSANTLAMSEPCIFVQFRKPT